MSITVREAILKAADWIEKNPNLYQFFNTHVPDCKTPGCMIGWVGYFMNIRKGESCWAGATAIIGVTADGFIDRLRGFIADGSAYEDGADDFNPTRNYQDAAKALRLYADKYHPASKHPSGSEVVKAFLKNPPKELEHAR